MPSGTADYKVEVVQEGADIQVEVINGVVVAGSPTDGQTIAWDDATQSFVFVNPGGGGGLTEPVTFAQDVTFEQALLAAPLTSLEVRTLLKVPTSASANFNLLVDESVVNSGTPNPVLFMGYNINASGSREDPADASLHIAIEGDYNNGSGLFTEFHVEAQSTAGAVVRPVSILVNKATGESQVTHQGDIHGWRDDDGTLFAKMERIDSDQLIYLQLTDGADNLVNVLQFQTTGGEELLYLGESAVDEIRFDTAGVASGTFNLRGSTLRGRAFTTRSGWGFDSDDHFYATAAADRSVFLRPDGASAAVEVSADAGGAGLLGFILNDTNLYRSASDMLATDDTFVAGGALLAGGALAGTDILLRLQDGDSNGFLAYQQSTGLVVRGNLGSAVAFAARPYTSAGNHFQVTAAGVLTFGDAGSLDTNLYREAADTLKTDDSFHVAGNLTVDGTGVSHRLIEQDGSHPSIVNTAAETTLYTHTIAPATMPVGSVFRLTLIGDYLNNDGGVRTLSLRYKFGATTFLQSLTVNHANVADRKSFRMIVEVHITGAAEQKCWASANFTNGATAGTMAVSPSGYPAMGYRTITEDVSSNKDLVVTAQHSAASANLDIRLQSAILERVA